MSTWRKKVGKRNLLTFLEKVPSLQATQAANAHSTGHQFGRHSKTSCKLSPIEILFNVCSHQNLRHYWPARDRVVKQVPHCSQGSTVATAQEARMVDSCLKTEETDHWDLCPSWPHQTRKCWNTKSHGTRLHWVLESKGDIWWTRKGKQVKRHRKANRTD